MAYGTVYRLNFCDDIGESKSLLLQRRNYTGAITDIIGGSSPIIITYKNEEDDKFNPVTSSSASINLIATESFNLNTFYTEDEKEWLVTLLTITGPGHGEYNQEWSGFLIPDTSNEPFLSYPYEFSLRASDLLGTLKDIPYMDGSLLIKKTASILTVLNECLAKTGLELPTLTGVNTYFNTTDATAQAEPLSKVYIDTNRFIDPNNKAFSCYDIIKSLALQFTANLKQSGGKWTFIDISEYKHNSFITRVGGSNIPFTPLIELLPEQIVNKDHNIEKLPAYGAVNSYYQYGFLSNKLVNGDFDIYDEATNKFAGWTQVGASTWSVVGEKKEYITLPPPIGEFFTGNRQMTYRNAKETIIPGTTNWRELDMDKYISSDLVAVSFSSLISFSIGIEGLASPSNKAPIMLKLSSPGETDKYWNSESKMWQTSPTIVINQLAVQGPGPHKKTVTIEAQYPPHDGMLEVRLYGLSNEFPGGVFVAITGIFENARLNISENQFYKSGIGNVSVATNYAGEFSKVPEPIVLLFGDDPNKNRTSWMRDVNGNPTETWFKATQSGVFSTPTRSLQAQVSTTVLHHHHKSSRRFEGSFRGYFKALNSFSVPLTNGRFIFLSGEFDIKSATARMVLAEILTDDFDLFDEDSFEDTGSFKDSEGNTVGSPGGVNIPPLPGGGGIPLSTIQDLIDDEFNTTDNFIRNQNTLQAGAKLNVYGGNFNNYLSIPAETPIVGDMIPGLWYDFVDETGTGGGGIAPPVISNLTDLNDVSTAELADGYVLYWHAASGKFRFKVDGAGVSSWNDLTDKPTNLSQFTNDLGNYGNWITGINSGMVTGALGYTPYNPANYPVNLSGETLQSVWNRGALIQGAEANIQLRSTAGLKTFDIASTSASDFRVSNVTDATHLFVIKANGNAGIGTTTPTATLDVNGTGHFSGNITAPTFTGNLNGNATSANAAGTAPWSGITGKPTNLSQFTNDLGNYGGWIDGINSGMVTTALGYTPYNPANYPVQAGGETLQSITNRGASTTNSITTTGGFKNYGTIGFQSQSDLDATILSAYAADGIARAWQIDKVEGALKIYMQPAGKYPFILNTDGTAIFSDPVTAPTFTGTLNGNANTADYATNAGTATNWSGSGALNNYLPLTGGTLTGALNAPSLSDGYINYSSAQINRSSGFVELQYTGTGGVQVFGDTPTPIIFNPGGSVTAPKIQATDLFSPPSGEPDPLDMIPGRWYDFVTE